MNKPPYRFILLILTAWAFVGCASSESDSSPVGKYHPNRFWDSPAWSYAPRPAQDMFPFDWEKRHEPSIDQPWRIDR